MFNLITFLRRRLRRPRNARISVNHHLSGGPSAYTSPHSCHHLTARTNIGFSSAAAIHPNPEKPIRLATFNAAMFSVAPAVPNNTRLPLRSMSTVDRPKSILKPFHASPPPTPLGSKKQHRFDKSRLRVSINLPDNEISRQLSFREDPHHSPLRPSLSFSGNLGLPTTRTALDVLRELDADVLALQDVKADEADHMRPLSDLATALEMNYVFAESWAPEYGNAILSKWPIKNTSVQKIFDDSDFRF